MGVNASTNNNMAPTIVNRSFTALRFEGDVPSDKPALRLTKTALEENPQRSSAGRVLYSKELSYNNPVNFKTTIKFTARGKEEGERHGNGLVFFIVPSGHVFPDTATGANLGIFEPSRNNEHIFAISSAINQAGDLCLGIHLGSSIPAASTNIPKECCIGKLITLTVSYDSSTHKITASAATDGSHSYEVSSCKDLTEILPTSVLVGLASSNGDQHVAVHEVSSLVFDVDLVDE